MLVIEAVPRAVLAPLMWGMRRDNVTLFRGECVTYAALKDGVPVGCICVSHGYVKGLYVKPEHRWAGIGTKLIAHVSTTAGRPLETSASKMSITGFLRNGWEVVHRYKCGRAHMKLA